MCGHNEPVIADRKEQKTRFAAGKYKDTMIWDLRLQLSID